MNDAGETRRLPGDALISASHVLGIAGADAELCIAGLRVARAAGHLEHRVAALPQPQRKLRTRARTPRGPGIGEQQPGFRPAVSS